VLVVDDNATNRFILEEMLASWHMRPTTVSDATAALAALRKAETANERFDVMISDCQMPDVDGFRLTRNVRRDKRLAGTPIVMLTSVGHVDGSARLRKSGVDACLTKPVKHSDLLDALATLFGVSTRQPCAEPAGQPLGPRAVRALHVLVAEDNLVNRTLVTKLLQKRGHRVTAVENGRQAVDAIASGKGGGFDAVLMDLQMPEMSGFEAAHAVRERERGSGAHLPLIALTAHAMQGDRERCLAAGMDGYLSKPIDVDALLATVERLGGTGDAGGHEPRKPDAASLFDEQAALTYTGGDRRLLKQVIALFRSDYPSALRRMDRALARRDAEALRMAAHGLKGAIATVGSVAGRQAAAEVEQLARAGDLVNAQRAIRSLRGRLTSLEKAFRTAGMVARARTPSARPRRPVKRVRGRL
jgi:CheY-like chemotaxis protein/HPt (histidine-containing phosphotransfer) domain-containing protein